MKIPGLKMDGLEKLIKAVKVKPTAAQIGVFDATQAAKAAAHEFGTSTIPKRSFIQEPVTEHLASYLESAKGFDKDALTEVVKKGSMNQWTKVVGDTALAVVHDAFASNGFGKWASKHEPGPILVKTGELRDSVTVQVRAQ